jgi:hypothetical protein
VSASISPSRSQRLIVVAQADPDTPMAGAPRFPKMSVQLSAAFARLATTMAIMIGTVRCMDWRLCRKTMKQKNGRTPGASRLA